MTLSRISFNLNVKNWKNQIDWKLLVLLLLFLNVKLVIKIPAVAIIYLIEPNFRFGFRFKNSRLPLFYLLIIGIAFLGAIINKSYENPQYYLVFSIGICFWALCILAVHQVKLSIEKNSIQKIHQTIIVFFVINILFSILNLSFIIYEIGTINPYRYQGLYQKYFMGTGDYIKGITFDTSTTNAVINAIGILYFLSKKNYVMLLLCMFILLLTGSNFLNITLLLILSALFLFRSTRNQKSMIAVCFFMILVFMVKVSPQNNKYVSENFKHFLNQEKNQLVKPKEQLVPIEQQSDSILNSRQRQEKIAILFLDSLKEIKSTVKTKSKPTPITDSLIKTDKGRIVLPTDNIHSATFQSIKTPLPIQQPILQFAQQHISFLPYTSQKLTLPVLPGKLIGGLQSFHFLLKHPSKLLFGNGIGNFSSKLAFKATGLGIAGGFPQKYRYINPDFMRNHLDLYLYYFSKQSGFHSLTNNPFSVYDQILTEYGSIGILAFIVFYIGFFMKKYKQLTYGIPILFLLLSVFFVDYWYEQLSIVLFFELILMFNSKEITSKKMEEANT
jgi:hypothetical protein